MSKFERINREPLVMGGQARIRDTGITVNEIVRLSLAGSSQAEILQQFPMLDAEDVHQALGWHSDYLQHLVSGHLFGIRGSASAINGYTQLLEMHLQNLEFEGKSDVQEWLVELRINAFRLGQDHDSLRRWAELSNRTGRPEKAHLIDWNLLMPYLDEKMVAEIPVFNGRLWSQIYVLSRTEPEKLTDLLCSVRGYTGDFNPAKIFFQESQNEAHFTVIRYGLQLEMLNNSSHLEFAQLLIFDSGSELKIRQEGENVIFEFALPIVDASG